MDTATRNLLTKARDAMIAGSKSTRDTMAMLQQIEVIGAISDALGDNRPILEPPKPTPRPWRVWPHTPLVIVAEDGAYIGRFISPTDAAYAVDCVNHPMISISGSPEMETDL